MTFEEFTEKYGLELNDQQLEAVRLTGCPVLLLAVPGSGKTTVLISRIGYMIHCLGVQPESILAVTYTKAAAADMRQRYASFFGEKNGQDANELRTADFLTINGLCYRILEYYSRVIKPNPFTMIEEKKQKNELLRQIFRGFTGENPTESDITELTTKIAYFKNMMSDKEEIKKFDKPNRPFSEMYTAYDGWMRKNLKMDYDDQMRFSLMIMNKYPQIAEHFREKYRYICVDEAQDTSKLQHAVISLLAQEGKTLFMVGDEDQSIYGFRAAFPEALVNFEQDYPGGRVLLLERNYRSNALIVKAADEFINRNISRHRKNMRATRPAGKQIREISLSSSSAQYTYLMKAAADCRERTAVLYRDNESALPLIDLLEREGIPYNIRAAELSFFTGRIVRDIIDILTLAKDPRNTEVFLRTYYKFKLYISKPAAQAACRAASVSGRDIWSELIGACDDRRMREKLIDARGDMNSLLTASAQQALYTISESLNYSEYLVEKDISSRSLGTLRAIGYREKSLSSLLERLEELRGCISGKKNDPSCQFILSTIHSSKGLEYNTVYLMDIYEGILPADDNARNKKADSDEFMAYEEERRLFYVAVTRARDRLNIFSVNSWYSPFTDELMGRMIPKMPAVECDTMPDDDEEEQLWFPYDDEEFYIRTTEKGAQARGITPDEDETEKLSAQPQKSMDFEELGFFEFRDKLTPGRKIELTFPRFGKGRIVSLDEDVLTVDFEEKGVCTLSVRYIYKNISGLRFM